MSEELETITLDDGLDYIVTDEFEIDGVKYKMLGAKKNKADVFLCPYENYEEAINVKNIKTSNRERCSNPMYLSILDLCTT